MLQRAAGWASIAGIVVTIFLPPRAIQFGAATTWLLAGLWLLFYSWHGYLVKEIGVSLIADDYVGRKAEITAIILMVCAVVVFVLPALGWLGLQLVKFVNQ